MHIGLTYNQRPDGVVASRDTNFESSHQVLHPDVFVEWDTPETVDAVASALAVFGRVTRLEAVRDFPERLANSGVDFLFNMAEGIRGPNREAQVPAIAEFLGIPYLGSDPLTLALALHKGRTKEILSQRGVPTPPYVLIESEDDLGSIDAIASFPVFLKPAWEGSSKGIAEANYADTSKAAVERARHLLVTYDEPVLVETYLPGDEFTIAILGNGGGARCLPLIRYRFDALPDDALPIMGYEAKWLWDQPGADFDVLECPADVPDVIARQVRKIAMAAYHALGCRDWSRVDVRLDGSGLPQVIELNPLPGVIPDPDEHSCFPWAADAAGMTYDELIQEVTRIAWRRATGREIETSTLIRAAS